MKIVKIYSNKSFQNTTFFTEKGGLNIVLGDAKGNLQGNSHSLGKSKFGELLNFMLLKTVNKNDNFFFYRTSTKEKFFDYIFYLEILLNSGKYLTIKRGVENDTKISFRLQNTISNGYICYDDFSKEETLTLEKAKKYLDNLLDFDFCKSHKESYRRLVNYSLRSEGDYSQPHNSIFQLSKFVKGKDKDWKPLIFNLLGFEGNKLYQKYRLEDEVLEHGKLIREQQKNLNTKIEDKDLIVGMIQNIESDRDILLKELQDLNFYNQDKEIINNLVGKIEQDISDFNTELYNLDYDIKILENSIRNDFSFDMNKVGKIFSEVEIYFPEQLVRSYEELLQFNHLITKERNTKINETLKFKKNRQREINSALISINKEREKHRDLIQDTSLFKKYSYYQAKVIEIERELTRYKAKLLAIEGMEESQEVLEQKKQVELQEARHNVKEIIDNTINNGLYMHIRKTFSDIVRKILNENSLIRIEYNTKTYNIDFKPEFPFSEKQDGATYYKILCVAFDLAVLINYRDKSHFRFVYHDDVFGGDDNGIKERFIITIKEICELHDIQYIFSAIKDNIPIAQDITKYIIVELHDKDDSGKLFKMTF